MLTTRFESWHFHLTFWRLTTSKRHSTCARPDLSSSPASSQQARQRPHLVRVLLLGRLVAEHVLLVVQLHVGQVVACLALAAAGAAGPSWARGSCRTSRKLGLLARSALLLARSLVTRTILRQMSRSARTAHQLSAAGTRLTRWGMLKVLGLPGIGSALSWPVSGCGRLRVICSCAPLLPLSGGGRYTGVRCVLNCP